MNAYFDRVREAEASLYLALSEFGQLAFQAANDPSLLDDQGWNTQMKSALSLLQANAQLFREIQPVPPSVQFVQSEVEKMAALIDRGVVAFGQGIERADPELVLAGNTLFQESTAVRSTVAQTLLGYCG